jgi:hypothetical protein
VAAGGLTLLTRLAPGSHYLTLILPAQLLLGLGMGCVFTPAITVATTGVDPRDAGIAAAVANTAMQVGGSIGTAVLNTVAITATRTYGATHRAATDPVHALVHGYASATTVAAVLLGVVALLAAALINTPRPHDTNAAGR